jgi:hypothetical protein
MTGKLLERLFTLDVRKDLYPGLANPALRLLLVDERNDCLYAVIDHWIDAFSISGFPQDPVHNPVGNAVYINDVALDAQSGVLVVGGWDGSGNEPLKVYDTVNHRTLWFRSNLSSGFMRRAPRLAQTRRRPDQMQLFSTNAHSVAARSRRGVHRHM